MWLGTGVYFFQGAYDRSRAWAELACQRPKVPSTDKPVVLHAKINTSFGIDLMTNKYWPLLRQIHRFHAGDLSLLAQNGIDTLVRPMNAQERQRDADHPFDHRLIDLLVDAETVSRRRNNRPEPTFVRCAFLEGHNVDARSWLFDEASIVVSVLDQNCIEQLSLIR